MTRARAALLGGAASLAAALVVTLVPAPEAQAAVARFPWWCPACGGGGMADALLNLLLLVPLGVAASMGRWTWWRTTALCLAVSAAIELAQGLWITGRDASLADIVTNTVGGALGWLVAANWRAISRPSPSVARGLAAMLALLFVGAGAAAIALLRPAMSRADYTRVRFTPAAAGRPTFPGTVTAFVLNGATYRDRSVPGALPPGDVVAGASFTWQPPGRGTATIVRIDGAQGDAVLSIDVRGALLRAGVHTRASSAGLRSPPVGVPLPVSLRPGDTVRAELRATGNNVMLSVTAPGHGSRSMSGTFRPWHAWLLLNPFTGTMQFDRRATGWTIVWLSAWLLLIGWYLRKAMDEKREARREKG